MTDTTTVPPPPPALPSHLAALHAALMHAGMTDDQANGVALQIEALITRPAAKKPKKQKAKKRGRR